MFLWPYSAIHENFTLARAAALYYTRLAVCYRTIERVGIGKRKRVQI